MKIFISYGHGDYTELVDRLFDALSREGHEPWKDDRYEGKSGIAPGEDFTEVIYHAIDESDFVVAFVTRNTKDKPYCRDERQYAYNRKGSHFIQVRLDGVDIQLGNARSYIDMSDVITTTGEISDRLFEDRFKALLAAFRDPASFAEGGITPWTKIDTHLKVPGTLKYGDFVANLDGTDFVGREWLLEKCKEWAQDNSIAPRVFVILGEAGTGKTAFVRRLASDAELVRSVHVCVYDRPSTRTAKDTIKDLAYVLAGNNPSYFEFLKSENLEKIKEMSIDGLFEYLFLEPLKTETGKYLLIIDGLDELEESNGLVPLMKIFRQYGDRINPNVSFLLTTRPDEYIVDHLRKISGGKPLDSVTLNKDVSRADLSLYIERKLGELGSYSEPLANKILDACDGNFEYLALLFKEAMEEGLAVSENMQMPRGLDERYAQYLDRRMETSDVARLSKEQRKLLSVMCASCEPMPLSLLSAVVDMDEDDVLDELELFGSLIRKSQDKRDPLISVFTKSFRDFLVSMSYRRYSADKELGNELISEYVIENFKSEKDFSRCPYLDKNAFTHLLRYANTEPERFVEYVGRIKDTNVDTALRVAVALESAEADIIDSFFVNLYGDFDIGPSVHNELKERRAADAIRAFIERHRADGRISTALILESEMLLWHSTPEITRKAEALFREALEYDRRACAEAPCYENKRFLAISLERLARILMQSSDPDAIAEAEALFKELLKLNHERDLEKNDYRSHRDYAIAHNHIGGLMLAKETAEGRSEARDWYMKSLGILEKNHRERPAYESRADLAWIYSKLGSLAQSGGTAEGNQEASEWYSRSIELYEQNYRENSCYAVRLNLASGYRRVAKMIDLKASADAVSKAKELYTKALKLYEQNYHENPCYNSRSCVSAVYIDIADLDIACGTKEALLEAEELCLKSLELDEQSYKENPCYLSRQSLSVKYNRLGNLAASKDTSDGTRTAELWYGRCLESDEQSYREHPCYETRRNLAISYGNLANTKLKLSIDSEEVQKMLRQSLDLHEENYNGNPCYQTRRDVAWASSLLGRLLEDKGTDAALSEAEQLFTKRTELDLKNYNDNPGYQSRRALSIAYGNIARVLMRRGTEEDVGSAITCYEYALSLDDENYREHPCDESKADLFASIKLLADAHEKLGAEDAMQKVRALYSRRIEIVTEDSKANPSLDNRRDLAFCAGKIAFSFEKEGTPEALDSAREYYTFRYGLFEEIYRDDPSDDNREALYLSAKKLGDILCKIGTAECIDMAKRAYLRCVDIRKQMYEKNRTYDMGRSLSCCYYSLYKLYKDSNDPDDIERALNCCYLQAEIDKRGMEENPTELSKKDLLIDYEQMIYMLKKKGDEKSLELAMKAWQIYNALKNKSIE